MGVGVPQGWKAEAGRGCSFSLKPFRWFWGPVDEECKWGCGEGVRVGEGKRREKEN